MNSAAQSSLQNGTPSCARSSVAAARQSTQQNHAVPCSTWHHIAQGRAGAHFIFVESLDLDVVHEHSVVRLFTPGVHERDRDVILGGIVLPRGSCPRAGQLPSFDLCWVVRDVGSSHNRREEPSTVVGSILRLAGELVAFARHMIHDLTDA